jgi:hypothetical protein
MDLSVGAAIAAMLYLKQKRRYSGSHTIDRSYFRPEFPAASR